MITLGIVLVCLGILCLEEAVTSYVARRRR